MTEADPFRAKLYQLLLLRLAGIMLAFAGLVWASTDKFGPPSPIGGAAVIAVGLVGSLLLARWLRLRWLKERQ
ncbi:MAG: hypothetical protein ACRCUI_08450 [Polymorphobacter sp.]